MRAAAVRLTKFFYDACEGSTRTRMFEIIMSVVPWYQALLGSLWRFSTAKLEARGAYVKPLVRKTTSYRPPSNRAQLNLHAPFDKPMSPISKRG